MSIIFISYATHDSMGFYNNQDILCKAAEEYGGVDSVIKLRGNDIEPYLSEINSYIKQVPYPKYTRIHVAKYYIWKSCVIKMGLDAIGNGDILVYHDAGRNCYPFKINCDLRWFCDYVSNNHKGLFVNFGPFRNKRFTKRECFREMNCDEEFYWNSYQANGSWAIYQKNDLTTKFVNEWKNYCMHPKLIVTDEQDDSIQFKDYEAHRHDQSILTNMLLKYHQHHGLPLDPKWHGKISKPWGWEKDMCLAIEKIKHYATK